MYFDKPTQVKFWDEENNIYIGGIAYCDDIICLHCGAVISIEDYLEGLTDLGSNVSEPIIQLPWISLSEECIGY